MARPSIRGSVFKGVIDDLARLQEAGRVSDAEVEAQLNPEHLILIKGEIDPAAWYPLACYEPIVRLLCSAEAAGRETYFIERGRASARRLIEAGMYQQLDFLSRWEGTLNRDASSESAMIADYASKLKMVISMASLTCNVGKWEVESDPDNPGRLRIATREARDYPETLRLATEGFLNECSRAAREDHAHLFTSERAGPNLILFRMNRDIKDLWGESMKRAEER
jgi:hypothetical protein